MYRPAPSVLRKQFNRKITIKSLLLGDNNNFRREIRKCNFALKNQMVFKRNFSSSRFFEVDSYTEKDLDPYSTYAESPIDSDVEGSTDQLAEKYIGNPSGLISEQTNKMESISKKSKLFISEVLQDRVLERSNLQPSDLKTFDEETRNLIKDEGVLCKDELARVATIRDDALDLINGRNKSYASDYESDYESDTSVNRIRGEYSNLDNNTSEIKNDHQKFISDALKNLPSNLDNITFESGNDTSHIEPSSNVKTDFSVEAGSGKKRDRDDGETDLPAKRVKVDSTNMVSNNTPDNIPSQNKSPLDYVIEKQQCDPYDFTDDME